jgi:site-specific DNA recombinase
VKSANRGNDSSEGELTDGILDQLGKYERAKIAECTRRGKLRRAREGKILPVRRVKYGFDLNATRDGYLINEEQMATVRRIFHMVGVEGKSHNAIKRVFDREGIPTPGGGSIGTVHFSGCACSTTFTDLTASRR